MHYFLSMTDNVASELFSAYEVAKGEWGDYALHEGQWKFIGNHHRIRLDSEEANDNEREQGPTSS
jgi:hypothetical protein